MNDILVSVITCTHNPRPDYLERVLGALRVQTLGRRNWEYIVVDNASNVGLAEQLDLSWHVRARVVREDAIGLTRARLRGIREARCDLLVFVDDDNELARDFLEKTLEIAKEKPFLGAWSGCCKGEFEGGPPEWTRRYWGNLVVRNVTRDTWSNLPRLPDTMPCGAGLCVRRIVAWHYLQLYEERRRPFELDRIGDSLLSGGDNDLAGSACSLGLGVGLMSALELTHLIPKDRLTPEYLARLAEGISYSSTLLDAEYGIAGRMRGFIGWLADQVRIFRQKGQHRGILRAVYRGRRQALQVLRHRH